MIKNPEIAVVLPVYNAQNFLKEAIDSVLQQTFKNFELIIINDGSTDSSESIILGYKDHRIRYIKQENTGIGGALRIGCELAQGKYIARMDADDICLPNRFELQKAYLDNNPNTVLVSNAVIYINESGNIIGRSFPYTSSFAIKKKLKYGSPICHPSVMMRKTAYELAGGYIDLELLEDLHLWIKLSKHGDFYNISSPLLKYRVLSNSISRSITISQFSLLINFLNNMHNDSHEMKSNIVEFNKMYLLAKKENKSLLNRDSITSTSNEAILSSKTEHKLYKVLTSLKLSETRIQFIMCNLKNMFTYIQNK